MGYICINLFIKINNENILKDTISVDLDDKIYEMRNKILSSLFDKNEYNYVNLTNITTRVYKDYGLLFFDKGLLPDIIDNYILSKFTIEDRTFDFLVEPCNKENKSLGNNIIKQNNSTSGIYNPNKRFNPEYEEKQEGYIYREEDFPPLS